MAMGFFNPVLNAVQQWVPSKRFRSEEGYRDDLEEYLRTVLKDYIIRPEGRNRMVDIVVQGPGLLGLGGTVGIEIKADLQSKSEKDRLIGQLENDIQYFRQVICVLCGDTDPRLKTEIHKWVKSKTFEMRQVYVVSKSHI
jgi:hypothetical protein